MTPELRRDIIEWDVGSFGRAIEIWDARLPNAKDLQALDIGARNGGLTLYLALHGCRVTCSDRTGPTNKARALHARHGIADRVTYADVDALAIPFHDASFDVVTFKSVLGGIGGAAGLDGQRRAVAEMRRVLKPGGVLLFAENLTASPLHGLLRRTLVPWGNRWRYVSPAEIAEMLDGFVDVRSEYIGLFGTFGRSERQREWLNRVDRFVERYTPARWKYGVIGAATKPRV